MNRLQYDWIHWDGHTVGGGAPLWIVTALKLGPSRPNGVMRLGNSVHVFGPDGTLAWICDPGYYILRNTFTGDLMVLDEKTVRDKFTQAKSGHLTARDRGVGIYVSANSHPRLHEAMVKQIVAPGVQLKPHETPQRMLVTMAWVGRVPGTETLFRMLTRQEFDTMIKGDMEEVSALALSKREHMNTIAMASELLDAAAMIWKWDPIPLNLKDLVVKELTRMWDGGFKHDIPVGMKDLCNHVADIIHVSPDIVKVHTELWLKERKNASN